MKPDFHTGWSILNDLYVHLKYRKTGAATLLLEMAKTFSVTQGGKGLALETARDKPSKTTL